MNVEFDYWCKHEISQMLQTDNPHFAGRALYWFNEPIIHIELLKSIAKKSRESLGERFTPEFHLDLPIARQLDGLGLTPEWKKRLDEQRKTYADLTDELVRTFFEETDLLKHQSCWIKLRENMLELYKQFSTHLMKDSFLGNSEILHKMCSAVVEQTDKCSNSLYERRTEALDKDIKKEYDRLSSKFYKFKNKLSEFEYFLRSNSIVSASSKAAVLLGDAGIGKSHLLCDISLKRLDAFLPTLFLLGQHYSGGNPLDFVLDSLDLKGISYRQVLGALDAAGESKGTRTLIVIDAINEGNYRDEWYDNISAFLSELSNYPNISIILSCRTTYKDYCLPAEIPENCLTRLQHYGFRGYEHRAASIYLSKQGISKPSAPITSPEFSNPLFLKTCCKALKANGYTSFPKGLNGLSQLFDFYLDSVQKIINRKKKYLPNEKVLRNAIHSFVKSLYPDHLTGIPITTARRIIDAFDPKPQTGDSLTDLFIDEGILSLDVAPDPEGSSRGMEVIRFTYERFSDHMVAQHILDQHVTDDDIVACFADDQLIGQMLKERSFYRFGGIIEALGICIPERFGCEFVDFVPKESNDYDWLFQRTFTDVVLWRSPGSFTDKTIELLNQIPNYGFHNHAIDILLSLSTEPDHPWNAEFLNENLLRMPLPERDAFWSTHIAISDSFEDEEQAESVLRTLIEWSLSANLDQVETERVRLTAITLTWLTTTSNRQVRDQATKSLARVLSHAPVLIQSLIESFNNNDDPYLIERLYAAVYGAVCNIESNDIVKSVAESVFEKVFRDGKPYPHILLRDYARGIMELAYAKDLLSSSTTPDMFRPPYNSDWPIKNPSKENIDKLVGDEFSSSIKSSLMGFPGDFGNYTMGCIHYWSPTLLSEEKPETSFEIQQKFANSLPDKLKESYLTYLDEAITARRNSNFSIETFLKSIKEGKVDTEETEESMNTWKELKVQIEATLDDEQKEYFRWASGLGIDDRPAAFSRKWAQRWVCKRAYELGWKDKLFEDFPLC